MPDSEYKIPNDPDVTPEDIGPSAALTNADLTDADLEGADLTSAGLTGADLTNANLEGADLAGANLRYVDLREADLAGASLFRTDLTGASLFRADLTDADLSRADLTDADLTNADLTDADLSRADLTDADLTDADLSDTNLRGTNLSRADLRDVDMIGVSANQGTTVGRICTGLSRPDEYDELAQGYHEFKEALSQEGLSQRARQARGLEQQARTAEAWERFKDNKWRQELLSSWPDPKVRTQFLTAVGGNLSRYLTGYGTRPLYVLLWTAAIILVMTALFALGPTPADGWQGGSLYYSVVTFVTAPPHPPKNTGVITQAAVLVETYLGTALIVLLGYVLGTRERV